MREELEKKISQSIRLIQTTCKDRGVIEVAYSGGKEDIMSMFDIFWNLPKDYEYFDLSRYHEYGRPLYKNTARNKREAQKKRNKRRK